MKNEYIRLLPAHPDLAGALCDYYQRNREFLQPFDPEREEGFFTSEGQRLLLDQEVRDREAGTSYRFYIVPAEEPEKVIGFVGLNNVVRGAFQSCFLGYKLDGDYLGRGYMPMAVDMLTGYAFETLGLHRIEANVMPRNRASLRVLEKCGFVNEGLSPAYLRINGVWEDHIHMVKLNGEM